MWELEHKESWAPKNWCFPTSVLEKTFESPLDCKKIKLVNPKGDQPWIMIGRTDVEAEVLILWPHQLIAKNPNAEKDWGQEEKGMTEDEMVDGITDSMDMSLSKLWERWWRTGKPGMLQSMGLQSRTWLRDWTITNNEQQRISNCSSTHVKKDHPCSTKIALYLCGKSTDQ